MNSALEISNFALGGFYLLLLLPLLLFHRWQLGLGRSLVEAALRMTLQLAVVGIYLQALFAFQSPGLNILWLSVMILVAGFSICRRAEVKVKKVLPAVIIGHLAALLLVLPLLLAGVIQAQPWWQAQYMIPVAGMLLGNCLTANVLALERWYSGLKDKQNEYQFYLALGAPNPVLPFIQVAVRAALSPQLASMATLGIVSLPGMMTGQILGGTEPILAVKYQLLIMVAIFMAAAVSVATTLVVVSRYAFNRYGQLVI
ncbi:YbbM seven transmembrane helix protein [Photobacterium marinum]|uniref:YbbM seven transmembrane helix protein n=1 Tax=Photobacterium marinum TaxID=1056511 RepID=L8JEC3_9GAMM|nr:MULTISPECIES: ABC transporter permease [Photobacterium]ELR66618.1 YbbM seven transmembrane helix protein [Photobacterium marinum]